MPQSDSQGWILSGAYGSRPSGKTIAAQRFDIGGGGAEGSYGLRVGESISRQPKDGDAMCVTSSAMHCEASGDVTTVMADDNVIKEFDVLHPKVFEGVKHKNDFVAAVRSKGTAMKATMAMPCLLKGGA